MNDDITELRNLLEAHDPARHVRADTPGLSATLQEIVGGSRPVSSASERRRRSKRRWVMAAPLTALVVGGAFAVPMVLAPGQDGPVQVGASLAPAVFGEGDYIDVTIKDPAVDPQRYRTEFAVHGLDVAIRMSPASPSLVGKLVSVLPQGRAKEAAKMAGFTYEKVEEGVYRIVELTPEEMKERREGKRSNGRVGRLNDDNPECGNHWCVSTIRVPLDLKVPLELHFGRAPKPDERYTFIGDVSASGEILEGEPVEPPNPHDPRTYAYLRVGELKEIIQRRGATVDFYDTNPIDRPGPNPGNGDWAYVDHPRKPEDVPDSWYVHVVFGGDTPGTVGVAVGPWRPNARWVEMQEKGRS
ncbi:hypothetical protein [Rhizohabitans arisaemae]|uniref:hypothetical protein n=1 Tax=Rhizohabitans arisaemae TaxID=2720610 RepID=UPI0024B08634|nr:hypothetical protein [Rhizohabitans arisaemae]